ncbi:MAG: sodium-translocating pyrophosphatase [Acidobacteriota bacterium]
METVFYLVPVAGLLALGFALYRSAWVGRQEAGNDTMVEIARAIREGAMAFLAREYRVLAIFVVAVAVLLAIGNLGGAQAGSFKHPLIAFSFVVGAICSGLAGYFGMRVATAANVRTTQAARTGLNQALAVAFAGGSVMGLCVVGLGVLGLSLLFLLYWHTPLLGGGPDAPGHLAHVVTILSGFSLGASSIALFARVGGGIYTKAADVGADLVGKVEAGIPEDDPRNPAVVADNVGDNVGDVAGMGADLFESYVGAIVGSMVIGAAASAGAREATLLPLILAGVGIVASIVGTFFVRVREGGNPQAALNTGSIIAGVLMIVAALFTVRAIVPADGITLASGTVVGWAGLFAATVAGLVAGILVGLTTEYYTSKDRRPAQQIARDSRTGPATNIISGLAVGMLSTALPVIWIAAAILISFALGGLYGIALAALGMLSTTGIQLAVDAYGPIADNAGGIAEMSGLPSEVRGRTDKLDAVGNTTAAIGKGFAIGSAALTALALFSAFQTQINAKLGPGQALSMDLSRPAIVAGLLVGAMLPFLFSSLAMRAVGAAAFEMIEEVRRQFREIPGLMEGKARAEYARCVDISTAAAIRRMIVPGLIAVLTPVVVGFGSRAVFGDPAALGGLLAGVTASGVLMAIFMANAGGAWDNAKKYVEEGHEGGKGSETHKATVIGDTVGDPFKDTAGPSLNILIKLMSVVALVIAPLL